jgi:hypothetical protein
MPPRSPAGAGGRAAAVGAVLLALAACGPGASVDRTAGRPAQPSPAQEPAVLGEAGLDSPNLRVQLLEVKRVGPELLSVTLAVVNRDRAAAVTLGATFSAATADFDSLADVYLIDEPRAKKYFVLRDRDGRAVGSQGIGAIEAGGRRTVWARFAGPPAGVERITVKVPHLPAFRNVAIAHPPGGYAPPAGPAGTARPGPSY